MISRLHFLLLLIFILSCQSPEQQKISLFLIGDSTMAEKDPEKRPETGWGEMISDFFNKNLIVRNHAVNGRSSKSFIDEGLWDDVLDSLQPGDYVCIQFGHNDQKDRDPARYTNPVTGYRRNLIRFIRETRAKGAHPLLATSIVRRKFNGEGTLIDTHGLYPLIVHQVSKEYDVPLIDLQLMTENKLLEAGEEGSRSIYLWLDPGEHPNFPQGRQDNTHLSPEGARMAAGLFAFSIAKSETALKDYLK